MSGQGSPGAVTRPALGAVAPWQRWIAAVTHEPSTQRELTLARTTANCMLITVTMAFVGMTYFAVEMFHLPIWFAPVVGAAYAGAVLALDRRILVALSRGGVQDRRRIAAVVVRLVIAGLIGYLVSQPLVMLAFRDTISHEIATYNETRLKAEQKVIKHNPNYGDAAIAKLYSIVQADALGSSNLPSSAINVTGDSAVSQAQGLVDQIRQQIKDKQAQIACEVAGCPGSSGNVGIGPVLQIEQAQLADLNNQLAAAQETLNHDVQDAQARGAAEHGALKSVHGGDLSAARTAWVNAKKMEAQKLSDAERRAGQSGLLDNLEALHRLEQRSWTIHLEAVLIGMLLFFLDTGAVVMKGMEGPLLAAQLEELGERSAAQAAGMEADERARQQQLETEARLQRFQDDLDARRVDNIERNEALSERWRRELDQQYVGLSNEPIPIPMSPADHSPSRAYWVDDPSSVDLGGVA